MTRSHLSLDISVGENENNENYAEDDQHMHAVDGDDDDDQHVHAVDSDDDAGDDDQHMHAVDSDDGNNTEARGADSQTSAYQGAGEESCESVNDFNQF